MLWVVYPLLPLIFITRPVEKDVSSTLESPVCCGKHVVIDTSLRSQALGCHCTISLWCRQSGGKSVSKNCRYFGGNWECWTTWSVCLVSAKEE